MSSERFIQAVYQKDYADLERLLLTGTDVNCVDPGGRTPLMHAVLAQDADEAMIRFLIQRGADPNRHDTGQRWTALHFAARDQKLAIVGALLQVGAFVNAEDVFGNTPLWRCVMETRVDSNVVELLLKYGADPSLKNRQSVSPRDVAERTGKTAIVQQLDSTRKP